MLLSGFIFLRGSTCKECCVLVWCGLMLAMLRVDIVCAAAQQMHGVCCSWCPLHHSLPVEETAPSVVGSMWTLATHTGIGSPGRAAPLLLATVCALLSTT